MGWDGTRSTTLLLDIGFYRTERGPQPFPDEPQLNWTNVEEAEERKEREEKVLQRGGR